MAWQEEDLHAILNCATPEEVFGLLEIEARRLGLQTVAWGMRLPIPVDGDRFVLLNNYSAAWQDRYAACGYLAVDPTVRHGLTSVMPILWSHASMQTSPEFWEDARSFGLVEGIAQSVFDGHGSCSMLSVSRDSEIFTPKEVAQKLPRISWLAQLAHAGMSRLILPQEIPETAALLSAKEKEVLKLSAAGKTSLEISERLHISKRTADWHLESAQLKLGAENRTDASVKAIVLGLV